MKSIYFDCSMGAAGDMITAALLGLVDDRDKAIEVLNGMGIPGVEFCLEEVARAGIVGNHVTVRINGEVEPDDWKVEPHEHSHEHSHEHTHSHSHSHEHEHSHNHSHEHSHEHEHSHSHEHSHEHSHSHEHTHRGLGDIKEIIDSLNVSEDVKEHAFEIYSLIAEGESKAHGHPITDVHFHEVGRMDAIADVTAACVLIDMLAPEKIMASPIAVGRGYVHCAHGIMPVPAPATLNILHGVPIRAGEAPSESCTPTGAAILKHFVGEFRDLPAVTVEKVGYGMGSRVFPGMVSALRALAVTEF